MSLAQKTAEKIASLLSDNERKSVKIAALETELARLRLEKQAEELIKKASQNSETAPRHLIVFTAEEFWRTRDQLVEQGPAHLSETTKMASLAIDRKIQFGLEGDGSDAPKSPREELYSYLQRYKSGI